MTLDEFVAEARPRFDRGEPRTGYVNEPGFSSFYMRLTYRYIGGKRCSCIDIASIVAERPGKGAFKALVARLRARYPEFTIYVESVLNPRFPPGLLRMGFQRMPVPYDDAPGSYYLPPV